MKYYIDSCIVIYIIEKVADYRDLLIELIPADFFVTNDKRLNAFKDIEILTLTSKK